MSRKLAAEFGHFLRDLWRATDASQYASRSFGSPGQVGFARSDFFATMVLADAQPGDRRFGAGVRNGATGAD